MQLYPESSSPYKTAEVVFIVADDTLDAYQQVVPKGTTLGWTPPYTNVGIFGDLYKAEHDIKKNIGEIPDPKDPSKMIKIIPNVQLSIEAVPNSKNNTMRIQMKKVD
jgi:hypothetical protein